MLADDAGDRFATRLSQFRLAGAIGCGHGEPVGIHGTAYALGTLNLLTASRLCRLNDIFALRDWNIEELLHPRTLLPRWPARYSHHSWRVSHWIGGVPSILKSLWTLVPFLAKQNKLPTVEGVLERADSLIDGKTGLLRAYKFTPLQALFRLLYRLRHDPKVGDVGGIAHLHWVNYASGRMPYRANDALFARAWKVLQRKPFIEAVPYCIDFDAIQLVRTAIPAMHDLRAQFELRALKYADDLCRFYAKRLDGDYPLHKLPGGLATLHECALATGEARVRGLEIPPLDIARKAYWI